jgi:hypothetical protein
MYFNPKVVAAVGFGFTVESVLNSEAADPGKID